MLKANFEEALEMAIHYEEQLMRARNQNWESGFLKGLRQILEALKRGERITVEEE